jgi:hypothetical protein
MSIFDFISKTFGSQSDTDLPIQVDSNLDTFVEEKRAPRQGLSDRDSFGLARVDFGDDSIGGTD